MSNRHITMSSSLQEIIYKPTRDGLERIFGPTEAAIMQYMWSSDQPRTSIEIAEALPGEREYSTVMTTITRLVDKGLLNKAPAPGRRANQLVFTSAVDSEDFYRIVVRNVVDALVDDCPDLLEEQLQRIYGKERFRD